MLAAPALDFSFDNDSDWTPPQQRYSHNRGSSVGNSWKVTSIGRGFNWSDRPGAAKDDGEDGDSTEDDEDTEDSEESHQTMPYASPKGLVTASPVPKRAPVPVPIVTANGCYTHEPLSISPTHSQPPTRPSSRSATPASSRGTVTTPGGPAPPASPNVRTRRRSSQHRVSLFAGRVSITPIEPHSPPPSTPKLIRASSQASFLSTASSIEPPPPPVQPLTGETSQRSISEFVIQGEIGRGAYGLVKKAREMQADGTLGPPLVIKQVIKSRILADCWKKHPKYGTIPIEIYVMSSISNTAYVLPPRRPWDPSRLSPPGLSHPKSPGANDFLWEEGKVVKGHPNICPLLDFFEDQNYYYLILPSTVPEAAPNQPVPPSDLFDLVESYPDGLPPHLVRTYLGQIADAMSFLHSKGIVHRDIKDENVVLGAYDRAVLIDFGSSGLVKKGGWDTFSGTLDYAGPEILRGERYEGKEQDVWAFGVVAYVLLVGECPFTTAAEAQEGLGSPFSNASIALDERCVGDHERVGEESDGGGALADAAALVRACLQVDFSERPTFDRIMQSRFLSGGDGWTGDDL
ncbi:kinase-like domain-containing protein [Vararia minispora EC-137]|uniref:Kinase-like domain-containing protein n=1 Tax=Vararia minispora EC-137 TaxID=1314806 RepID=A0ACB8QFR7_9AGAM|nr:kinase-like domain-containing protein [Vararia minispora EC-137]